MDTFQIISWAVISIVLIVVEIFTVELLAIWFGMGGIFAFFTSLITNNSTIQFTVFILVSLFMLLAIRPISKKYLFKSKIKTNSDSLISQNCIITQSVDNKNGQGRGFVNGLSWAVKSFDDSIIINENTVCEIIEIVGVTLVVRPN